MLYRAFLLLITGLFVMMWTLLIRSEVGPGDTGLRTLPVEHVLREIFHNEKPSQLIIRDGAQRIGNLRIVGRPETLDGVRALEFFGGLQLTVPGGTLHRASWSGDLEVTREWEISSLSLTTATREIARNPTPPTRLDFLLSPLRQTASYVLKNGENVVSQQTFSTDEAGLMGMLQQLGVDETFYKQLHLGHGPKPVITARQASLMVDNLKLETYLLAVVLNGQTLVEAHISQLGEVLQARTLFGWTLDVR